MKKKIIVLPGDGVGPEVTEQAIRVLQAVGDIHDHRFEFEEHSIGGVAIKRHGTPLPEATVEACLTSDAVLLGAVGSPEFDDLSGDERPEAGLLALRKALGAFANLRPAIAYESLASCSPLRPEICAGADVLIVRELLGGLYFGTPRGNWGTNAVNTTRYTAAEVERVARVAFRAASLRRGLVTSVDKANVLETSSLWRTVVTDVARDYPHVRLEHMYVDNCAMQLVSNPRRFDVILTENLFGDILSDEAGVITGSLGMLPSASIGGPVDIYEPVHGSAPDLAGQGVANPLGAIASAALFLRYSAHLEREARDVEDSIREVLRAGYRTADLVRGKGHMPVTTSEMGMLVSRAIAEVVDMRHPYHAV